MVGMADLTRLSSVIFKKSSSGTLKSHLIKTLLSLISKSLIERISDMKSLI
jgi:hypothetical protein